MSVTIYHNPRCSKSRQTLELIKQQGVEPTIVEYLNTPPSVIELKDILVMLDKRPADIVRRKEAKEEGVDVNALDDNALLAAMVGHPRIIERPIVVKDGHARLGRPPEAVLELF